MIELMRQDDSVDAPADSLRWASNLFRTRAAEPKTSIVKKLAAVFQIEIAPEKPAFGERSGVASSVRQILYRAEDNAVDLRIERTKKGFTVRGQILGEGFGNAKLHLADDGADFYATANETSEFEFNNVPAGRYELTLQGKHVEITLKAIDLT